MHYRSQPFGWVGVSVHFFSIGMGGWGGVVKKEGGRERLSCTEPRNVRFLFTLGPTFTSVSLKPGARSQTFSAIEVSFHPPLPPKIRISVPMCFLLQGIWALLPLIKVLFPHSILPLAQALFLLGSRPNCLPVPPREAPTRGRLSPRIGLSEIPVKARTCLL